MAVQGINAAQSAKSRPVETELPVESGVQGTGYARGSSFGNEVDYGRIPQKHTRKKRRGPFSGLRQALGKRLKKGFHSLKVNLANLFKGMKVNTRNVLKGAKVNTHNLVKGAKVNTENLVKGAKVNTENLVKGAKVNAENIMKGQV